MTEDDMVKRPATWLAVTTAALAVALAAPAAQAATTDPHAATQALLDRALQNAPGAAVYAGDASGSWSLHAGTGDISGSHPIGPDQHYRIASQTKTFTATVVLQLVDEGKVALDTPIEHYLPGVVDGNGYDGDTITVRELLQQDSSIPTNDSPHPQQNSDGSYTLANIVRDGLSHQPDSTPGTHFEYSNTNYEIAGMLIEAVTGQSVADAITSRIITPLGLTGTSFPAGGQRTLPSTYVHGYAGGRVGSFFLWADNTTSVEPSEYSTSGAMISTEQDMTTFELALTTGQLLSPAALAEMHRTISTDGWAPPAYAYGLGVVSHDLSCGGTAWGHPGNVPGYATWTAATADGRYATVVTNTMTTAAGDNDDDLRFQILDSALCGH
jgi:D-alanyl-D-alanine carboxypeptidase